jgi:hypothetical protein
MEKTSLWSARIDQRWNNRNNSFLRVGVSPSLITGLPSTSQNQVFGQNSGSRAGYNQSRDFSATFQHDTIISDKTFNEFRTQFARRGLHFGFSQLPGGSNIGVNIPGFAYFGREPYSTVDRIERRTEFTDHLSLIRSNHTFKIGGDFNLIQLRSKKAQIFELDFGGDVNFGGFSASTFGFPDSVAGISLPGTTGLQSYGLGIPTSYIQGIGNSNNPFDNIPMGFFLREPPPRHQLRCALRRGNQPVVYPSYGGECRGGESTGGRGRHSAGLQQRGPSFWPGLGPGRKRQDRHSRRLRYVL